jgi:beta-1,2-mannobiose phosphorylase / 1,2-beta-oligomannan phosphorylase
MVKANKEGVIISKTNLGFENESVLNPAVIVEQNTIHLFYRAVRTGNYSSIGYCTMDTPLTVKNRNTTPLLFPQLDYESHGMEDPRIVKIDDIFFLTYTAYDGPNALGALATSTDLQHFEKQGIICPKIKFDQFIRLTEANCAINEKYARYSRGADCLPDKDLVFFPRRINRKLYFLHRIKPDIQIVAVNNLDELTPEFWENYFLHFGEHIALCPKFDHEVSYVGCGCPPIETALGWLFIYHGVKDTINGYEYAACAALLDLDDPSKEISRLSYPLFKPETDYETIGDVSNVCFPTGTALIGDILYIYYGAADQVIACVSVSLSALLKELELTSVMDTVTI